jgi:hypothetical protein
MGACQSAAASGEKKRSTATAAVAAPASSPVKLRHSNSTGSLKSKFSAKLRNSQIYKLKSHANKEKRNSVPSGVQQNQLSPAKSLIGEDSSLRSQLGDNLPLIKVKLVDFLEFQEFNTLVETIEIKTCNETYFLKNHSESSPPSSEYRKASKDRFQRSNMSSASSSSSLPKQVLNEIINTNANTNAKREPSSTTIPIMNRFGFKPPLKTANTTSGSSSPTNLSDTNNNMNKVVYKSGEIEITTTTNSSYASSMTTTASPTTSTTSSSNSTHSTNLSRRRYLSPHKAFVNKPISFVNPQPAAAANAAQNATQKNPGHNAGFKMSNLTNFMSSQQQRSQQQQSQSSSMSSLASSNSSTNLSSGNNGTITTGNYSNNHTNVNSNRVASMSSLLKATTTRLPTAPHPSGTGTIKMNLENSNIIKLPVKKEIATFSVPLKQIPSTTTTTTTMANPTNTVSNKTNNSSSTSLGATHRKHSFTPYSLNINGVEGGNQQHVVTEKPPESPHQSTRLPAPTKILRYGGNSGSKLPSSSNPSGSSKLTATSNLKKFASNRSETDYMNDSVVSVKKEEEENKASNQGVSISIKREDSAYCSSTSSTVSAASSTSCEPSVASLTSNANHVSSAILNSNEANENNEEQADKAENNDRIAVNVDVGSSRGSSHGFEIERDQISDREHAVYDKHEVRIFFVK